MTIEIKLKAIADAISGLTITGVNMFDIDHIPLNCIDSCPAFFPVPNGFVTDFHTSRESLGDDSTRKINVVYVLNYRYLHAPIGSGSTLENYAGILSNMVTIVEVVLGNTSLGGAIDIDEPVVSDIGAMTDLAGQNQYHGVDIALRVLEFVQ
jgi:hypothetical protein